MLTRVSLLDEGGEIAGEENVGDEISDDRGDADAEDARHHETVVEQVFADDRRSGPVEIDRGDVGGIVRDEEIAVHAREDAQQHGTGDAEFVGEREHGHDDGTLRVDEYGHEEEYQRDRPGILRNDALECLLHDVHVVAEIGVGEPGDPVDCDDGDHAALPDSPGDGFLRLGLERDDHHGGGADHDDLDDRVHLRNAGDRLERVGVDEELDAGETDDDGESGEEYIDAAAGFPGNGLVEGSGRFPVHVFVGFRVGEPFLKFGVLVEVEAAAVGRDRSDSQSAEAGRDRNHEDLGNGHVVAVGVGYGHESDDGSGDRGAGDTHLGGDGGDRARTFGTDAFLQGDVADDRHEGIDDMAGSDEDGQEESAERGEEGDVLRVLAEHLLGDLDHPVHASGGLQDAGTGHCRDDDVDDVGGRGAGLQAETEDEDGETDAGNGAEGQAAVAGTHIEGGEDDQQFDDHSYHKTVWFLVSCHCVGEESRLGGFHEV